MTLERGEVVVGLASLLPGAPTLALATASGVIKRVADEAAPNRDSWEVIRLAERDVVVGALPVADDDELVLLADDAQLLRFPASSVRPQGRAAGGMAGIKLAGGAQVIALGVWSPGSAGVVVTLASDSAALLDAGGSLKVTHGEVFPGKGRATGGVRAHRFLKGEDVLSRGWITTWPAAAASEQRRADRPAGAGQPPRWFRRALRHGPGCGVGPGVTGPQSVDVAAGPGGVALQGRLRCGRGADGRHGAAG